MPHRRVLMDESGTVSPAPLTPSPTPAEGEQDRAALFLSNPVCFSSVMVRRAVFDHLGGFDPDLDLAIDYDLWLRVARHWQFARVSEPLVLYRTGHGSLSKKLADRVAIACSIMTRHARTPSPDLRRRWWRKGTPRRATRSAGC